MISQEEEKCPVCHNDFVHIIRCWVLGKEHNCYVLNGVSCEEDIVFLKLFPHMTNYRGVRIIILFESEHCDHFWFKSTYFHKGQTFSDYNVLSNSELKKTGLLKTNGKVTTSISMWRD